MRIRASGRLARLAIAAVTVTALTLGLSASPALADLWQHSDGFEGNPAAVWTLAHAGTGDGWFEIGAGTARTGSNNAFITATTDWSSVGKQVRLTPRTVHQTTCGAGFQVNPIGIAMVNVEVINPVDWTYIALRTVRLTGSGYRLVATPTWANGPVDVFVRISVLAGRGFGPVRVDDMVVQCAFTREN
jgi:hypothetical protein